MSDTAPRVGVFGGSFDPVHNAHLALARLALSALRLDQLIWVPAGQPWQKQRAVTPAADREAMVRLAIEGEPRFSVSRAEIERAGPSYMADTVSALRGQQPGTRWFLVIGQDQYAGLHTWHRWHDLLAMVTVAVANRPGASPAVNAQVQAMAHETVALPMTDISSTDIRERIASGRPIDDLVPAAVARYIARHDLYRDRPPTQELNGHS